MRLDQRATDAVLAELLGIAGPLAELPADRRRPPPPGGRPPTATRRRRGSRRSAGPSAPRLQRRRSTPRSPSSTLTQPAGDYSPITGLRLTAATASDRRRRARARRRRARATSRCPRAVPAGPVAAGDHGDRAARRARPPLRRAGRPARRRSPSSSRRASRPHPGRARHRLPRRPRRNRRRSPSRCASRPRSPSSSPARRCAADPVRRAARSPARPAPTASTTAPGAAQRPPRRPRRARRTPDPPPAAHPPTPGGHRDVAGRLEPRRHRRRLPGRLLARARRGLPRLLVGSHAPTAGPRPAAARRRRVQRLVDPADRRAGRRHRALDRAAPLTIALVLTRCSPCSPASPSPCSTAAAARTVPASVPPRFAFAGPARASTRRSWPPPRCGSSPPACSSARGGRWSPRSAARSVLVAGLGRPRLAGLVTMGIARRHRRRRHRGRPAHRAHRGRTPAGRPASSGCTASGCSPPCRSCPLPRAGPGAGPDDGTSPASPRHRTPGREPTAGLVVPSLALGLAAVPLVVATVRTLLRGWMAIGDNGLHPAAGRGRRHGEPPAARHVDVGVADRRPARSTTPARCGSTCWRRSCRVGRAERRVGRRGDGRQHRRHRAARRGRRNGRRASGPWSCHRAVGRSGLVDGQRAAVRRLAAARHDPAVLGVSS